MLEGIFGAGGWKHPSREEVCKRGGTKPGCCSTAMHTCIYKVVDVFRCFSAWEKSRLWHVLTHSERDVEGEQR